MTTPRARPTTYSKGNKVEYTGKVEELYGGTFYQVCVLEGSEKGKLRDIVKPPPSVDKAPEAGKAMAKQTFKWAWQEARLEDATHYIKLSPKHYEIYRPADKHREYIGRNVLFQQYETEKWILALWVATDYIPASAILIAQSDPVDTSAS